MSSAETELTDNPVVEIEFRVPDTRYPLAALSAETGCETELLQIFPRSDDSYTAFFQYTGAPVDDLLDFYSDLETVDVRVVSDTDDRTILECRITKSEDLFVPTLTDSGAIPQQLRSANGVVDVVAEVPAAYSACDVIKHFQTVYPSMEFVAQRQKDHTTPIFKQEELTRAARDMLTDRQYEVLTTAYAGGYYDWPRGKSGEELADELGVTLATFSQHMRTAERKLLSIYFQ